MINLIRVQKYLIEKWQQAFSNISADNYIRVQRYSIGKFTECSILEPGVLTLQSVCSQIYQSNDPMSLTHGAADKPSFTESYKIQGRVCYKYYSLWTWQIQHAVSSSPVKRCFPRISDGYTGNYPNNYNHVFPLLDSV